MKGIVKILIPDANIIIDLYDEGLIELLPIISKRIVLPNSVKREIKVKKRTRVLRKYKFFERCTVGEELQIIFLSQRFLKGREKKKVIPPIKGEAEMIIQTLHYLGRTETGIYCSTRDKKAIKYCKDNGIPILTYEEIKEYIEKFKSGV